MKKQRRFSRAVGSDNRQTLTVAEFKTDILEGPVSIGIAIGQMAHFQNSHQKCPQRKNPSNSDPVATKTASPTLKCSSHTPAAPLENPRACIAAKTRSARS